MPASRSASAPGSLMLLGEHAVLHGHVALVAAINRRIKINITLRHDGMVQITSALGSLTAPRQQLPETPAFRFVIACLAQLPETFADGCAITINADMPATIGFGTSAAVTVAMLAVLSGKADQAWLLREARSIIQRVQGRGSGADAAASAYGGVVRYRMSDPSATVVSEAPHPVAALYCGYKTPTPDVIKRVDERWRDHTTEREVLYTRMGQLAAMGVDADFGTRLNEGQSLMQQLGVSTPELDDCISLLRAAPDISGAKISGSGLGDCAIGWGTLPAGAADPGGFPSYAVTIDAGGVRLE